MEKAKERLEVLDRIATLEAEGKFDEDVEPDLPASELLPEMIDYLHKKLKTKILTSLTLKAGKKFFKGLEKNGSLVIKDAVGTENLLDKKQGAILTCNHINPFDNYVILKGIAPSLKKGRFTKVIKEGNYTNPPKGFEMFMRYGDTMPLSSNRQTMRNFLQALDIMLGKGKKVLVYPEQAMWWNYKKPRPFKPGAFRFAVTSNVPVQPLFITMEDTEQIGTDGFPILAYTLHICPAIYPDSSLTDKENIKRMSDLNYQYWVEIYEKVYGEKLTFNTHKK